MEWVTPGPAFLFCPADRPERFAKADAAADVVILDLEDGVAPERREQARHHVRAADLPQRAAQFRFGINFRIRHDSLHIERL